MAIKYLNYYVSNDDNLMIIHNLKSDIFCLYFGSKNMMSGTLDFCKRNAREFKSVKRLSWKIDNLTGIKRLREKSGWR